MRRFFEPVSAPPWLKAVLTSIRSALGDIFDTPIRPFQAATADLPAASDWTGGWAWDNTLTSPVWSDGSAWKAPYYAGGTDVALADGGTGASLADPNADRIMFWDDSDGQVTWLVPNTGLSISGTDLNVTVTQYTDEMAQDAVGGILTNGTFVNFVYNDAANTISALVNDDSISNAKLRNSFAVSVIGRAANTDGDPADIIASANGQVLRRASNVVGFGQVASSSIDTAGGPVVLGKSTAGAGAVEELSVTGTGNVVFSASPTLTGTITAATANFSGIVTVSNDVSASGGGHVSKAQWTGATGGGIHSFMDVASSRGRFGTFNNTAGTYSPTDVLGSTIDLKISGTSVLAATSTEVSVAQPFKLPSYAVASLPSANDGALAFATNGRKTGEGAGAGTGVPVYRDGGTWYRFADDTAVAA